MALKTFKPYTKSSRGTTLVDRTGLWKGKPFKSLVSAKNAMKGRNNNGHITSINRAGGHKKSVFVSKSGLLILISSSITDSVSIFP